MTNNININIDEISIGDLVRIYDKYGFFKSQIYEVFKMENVLAYDIRKTCDFSAVVYTPLKLAIQRIVEVYRKTDNGYEMVYCNSEIET